MFPYKSITSSLAICKSQALLIKITNSFLLKVKAHHNLRFFLLNQQLKEDGLEFFTIIPLQAFMNFPPHSRPYVL